MPSLLPTAYSPTSCQEIARDIATLEREHVDAHTEFIDAYNRITNTSTLDNDRSETICQRNEMGVRADAERKVRTPSHASVISMSTIRLSIVSLSFTVGALSCCR